MVVVRLPGNGRPDDMIDGILLRLGAQCKLATLMKK